ncbi:hypothetical protein [Streptomyces mangrovisoli]|uniref:DNA-directed RNA polymerase specialized sigma24 family protein n=1 Tax=Streptomyces mangrovisoli TaxID=1428628 RepID=A0A1J4NPV6_9ACTN|nr:hypothetical protein [Streptomyces mangrovisoli]OIJ64339.1 hypothetical protein WN71_029770 [Streptomyces mangrovisoli]
MHLRQLRSFRPPGRAGVRQRVREAESVLVEQYGDLVRLAHLVLPASLGRHRRVLVAHSVVQRALRRAGAPRTAPAVPPPRRASGGRDSAEWSLLAEVVRAALAHGRRPRLWPARLTPPGTLLPRLPVVVGLRLFPRSGGADELALAQRLSAAPAAARAAFLLTTVHGLSDDTVHELLAAAGVADPAAALRTASVLEEFGRSAPAALLASPEFDACALQAGPTDLLRRSRRFRLALGAAAIGAVTAMALIATSTSGTTARPEAASPAAHDVPRPADLQRTAPGVWDDTSRVDFTAWPPRGPRVRDEVLLGRALSAWQHPRTHGTRLTLTPATAATPPAAAPQLLYAGDVDGRAIVLFYDGQRLARYSERRTAAREAELSVARADDADVTTAAAVTLNSGSGGARYLLAPWVAEAQTRDLLHPDTLGRALHVSQDGLTDPLPVAPATGSCDSRPVLQLRSSERIAEHHAFLLAGLGDLSPVHLTYTPLPGPGAPARQPREATGPAALLAWAHQACALGELRGGGVRAVNAWDFAAQSLPDGGGHAVWTCARADTWRGPGDVTVSYRVGGSASGAPARTVARARATAACSRFGQHVVAGTGWRSPHGRWYVLAAGSRAVTRLSVTGTVAATTDARTLAVPAPRAPRVHVTARLVTGERLNAVGTPS